MYASRLPRVARKSSPTASGRNKTNVIFKLLKTQALNKSVITMQESSGVDMGGLGVYTTKYDLKDHTALRTQQAWTLILSMCIRGGYRAIKCHSLRDEAHLYKYNENFRNRRREQK